MLYATIFAPLIQMACGLVILQPKTAYTIMYLIFLKLPGPDLTWPSHTCQVVPCRYTEKKNHSEKKGKVGPNSTYI